MDDMMTEQFDPEFGVLKRTVRNAVLARREQSHNQVPLPQQIGVKLTNRCNLRCEHCYQWNEDGYHWQMSKEQQRQDLSFDILKQLLIDSRPARSRMYFWGGEPLVYRNIRDLLTFLEEEEREIIFCTNGHYIERHIDQLCRVSDNLELLLALEGPEDVHDAIRGKGSHAIVMGAIDRLVQLRKEGKYRGKISVHTVFHDQNIGKIEPLIQQLDQMGLDLVILCFPWYISQDTSARMNKFVDDKFDWLIDVHKKSHNWDAFKYHIDPANAPALIEETKRIFAQKWKCTLWLQPNLEPDEVETFLRGEEMTTRCAPNCTVIDSRIDITPDGRASACKFFSEFFVGDLNEARLGDVWKSQNYERIRAVLGSELSPACSKCSVLYLQNKSMAMHI